MAHQIGAARPYARAIYELARQEKQVVPWQKLLELAALILSQPEVDSYVTNPKVSSELATKMIIEIIFSPTLALPRADAQGREQEELKNLIALLAANRKLTLLPAIAQLFISYAARDSQTEKVEVRSAVELDANTKEKLVQTLAQRLQKKIDVTYQIDTSLIGGATIRTEQWVLDGSIKYQLQELRKQLTSF
jgi:F-type H+-transporting ATPase subunit delta